MYTIGTWKKAKCTFVQVIAFRARLLSKHPTLFWNVGNWLTMKCWIGHYGNHLFWYVWIIFYKKTSRRHIGSQTSMQYLYFSHKTQRWTFILLTCNIEGFFVIHWILCVYSNVTRLTIYNKALWIHLSF